ncbi:MAG: ribosomal-protein-alanine N-acetyltransferase [Rickettsiales bacterium]|nr:ribosomal-protein-alanine N-acetyltransferase [Rickettsiales bacterium]|tara:strand:+ start:6349 stop:6804 length:456 start_codon:yes stop_codon:yes gene_type:complete
MLLRRAERIDSALLESLEQRCFGRSWPAGYVQAELQARHAEFWLLQVGGMTCGYLHLLAVAGEGSLLTMGVVPEQRRIGLGRVLVEKLLARLTELGCSAVHLEVKEGNHAARRLYESCGFIESGRRKNYYREEGEDALLMHRALDSVKSAE